MHWTDGSVVIPLAPMNLQILSPVQRHQPIFTTTYACIEGSVVRGCRHRVSFLHQIVPFRRHLQRMRNHRISGRAKREAYVSGGSAAGGLGDRHAGWVNVNPEGSSRLPGAGGPGLLLAHRSRGLVLGPPCLRSKHEWRTRSPACRSRGRPSTAGTRGASDSTTPPSKPFKWSFKRFHPQTGEPRRQPGRRAQAQHPPVRRRTSAPAVIERFRPIQAEGEMGDSAARQVLHQVQAHCVAPSDGQEILPLKEPAAGQGRGRGAGGVAQVADDIQPAGAEPGHLPADEFEPSDAQFTHQVHRRKQSPSCLFRQPVSVPMGGQASATPGLWARSSRPTIFSPLLAGKRARPRQLVTVYAYVKFQSPMSGEAGATLHGLQRVPVRRFQSPMSGEAGATHPGPDGTQGYAWFQSPMSGEAGATLVCLTSGRRLQVSVPYERGSGRDPFRHNSSARSSCFSPL